MKKVALLLLLICSAGTLPAQTDDARGLTVAVKHLAGQDAAVGIQYAILIAINKYKHWNALRHPVEDAQEIKEILSRRYYVDRFIELYDGEATKAGIIKLFSQLINTTRSEDGVFIFYAGHGHLDQMSDTGFWIPADGGLDRFEQDNWLPNSQIRGFISKMKARHIVLMSDSCFSGDILNPTRAITPEITNEYFRNAYSRISRQVLTSGASEAVPDASAFARGLKQALEGNTAAHLDPLMLYNQIRLSMTDSTPLLGDLKDCGHQEGASFLFFLKDIGSQAPGGEMVPAESGPALTIEKPSGTLVIRAGMEGRLFVDAQEMGTIPEGGTAKLERLAVGSHIVSMLFEGNLVEGKTIRLKANENLSIAFGECVRNKGSVPVATIKIDGNFDDWKDIRPLFIKDPSDRSEPAPDLMMVRVCLAKDSEYLYVRFDIADQTKPSFLRPYNFSKKEYSQYEVAVSKPGSYWITLTTAFDKNRNTWSTYVAKGNGTYRRLGSGTHQMKGSTLEARFPLSLCKGLIEEGLFYRVWAQIGYNTGEPAWQWRRTDGTESKELKF